MQVGDPFMEKLLLEACLEVMKTDALVGIQDMGAAGLTCSTCEMGARGGVGIEIDVVAVPQRETGMTPYEIMLSESQERMLLVVKAGREAEVERIFEKWDLHAVRIGEVTADGLLRVKENGRGRRRDPEQGAGRRGARLRPADGASRRTSPRRSALDLAVARAARPSPAQALLTLLASPDIASKRWVYRQYDHMVRTNTLVLPGHGRRRRAREGHRPGAGDVGRRQRPVLLPRSVRRARSSRSPRRRATSRAPAALPIGATNCLNFGNPEKPEIMWQFAEAVARHRRRLPRARHPDYRRQRQPLQRDRRHGHPPDARARAWSG